jgi:tetratricopeptide (TPR) repeat protein
MIRQDYLLRMVDRCVQALTRSLRLTELGEFPEARAELDQGIRNLAGLDLDQVSGLTESELMTFLLRGEPTQVLRQKCMLLTALLRQAGDVQAAQGNKSQARSLYLKALNLQLDVLAREAPFDIPEAVPRVEVLLRALEGESLPLPTYGALMQYWERSGQYAKAEDALFAMLEAYPAHPALAEFGLQFYERLLRQSDEALESGNLPRSEVLAGLAELKSRRVGPS